MPVTTLDANAALVVIDLQKIILGLPAVHPISEIIARTARLASAFRARNLPVVLVNVAGIAPGRTEAGRPKFSFPPDWTDLVPELQQTPADLLITKQRVGAFHGTSLDDSLRKRNVTQIFLTGVSTTMGVESTARGAYDLGYNVAFVVDAMTDLNAEMHSHSIEKVFPKIGESDTTENILKLLKK
jgi:nicotinamidase-related amidase